MKAAPVTAFSYIRFSHPDQSKGDSLRRQEQRAEDFCKRKGWKLDASLTLRDLGVSAFRGDNALVGNLRTFLDAIDRGTVLPGSALIVESADRISRQGIDEGYDLCKRILKSGVRIVTLTPEREFGPEAVKSLSKGALELQLILERAAEESETKSQRVGAAWGEKKRRARAGEKQPPRRKDSRITASLTNQLPAWVKDEGGKLVLIPERAAAVRRVFALACAGYGLTAILKRLEAEKVRPFGASGKWVRSYLALILKDGRATGEFQPRRRDGSKDGPAIADYYPRVVDDASFYTARKGAEQRWAKRGRTGKHVNVFAGLVKHARDGDSYFCQTRPSKHQAPLLINRLSTEGKARQYGFPFAAFEEAIFEKLIEVDAREVLGKGKAPDDVLAIAGELGRVEARIAELEAELRGGDVATLAKYLRELEADQRRLAADLADARKRAAHPLGEAWGEAQSLLVAVASAPDPADARLRLRAALRRIIAGIYLLVVPKGRNRIAAVQVWFTDGKRSREYAVYYAPPYANQLKTYRERVLEVESLATVGPARWYDLRKPADARALEADLAAVEVPAAKVGE